ncbi:MAG TPA: hypothetical protein VE570_11360 [Thermoleophilaceae bacterium]|nr:hypothetical protein [Thermoleophilaceae bacterium]
MENVERQDERERELRADVDELEQQGDELEERGERLDEQIDDVREEFERKKRSSETPGAQDPDWEPTGSPPGDAGGTPRGEDSAEDR